MSFTGLADNQAVSYGNLQDAVNNGIFTLIATIPSPTNRESTKSVVAASVSGFNPNYPPYAVKASNAIIVKQDIYQPGNFILDAQYGKSFTSMSGSVGFPTFTPAFTYPVTGGNTTSQYNGAIAAQTITVGLTGTLFVSPAKVVLYVDGVQVDCQDIANGVQTKTLNLSVTVGSPSTIKISINGGTCSSTPTTPVFSGKSFSSVAVNKDSGQYMIASNANLRTNGWTAGYLYYSSNYGSSWSQASVYGYWISVSMSKNGQYALAVEAGGYAYSSSNYGASWTQITYFGIKTFQSCCLSSNGQYQIITTDGQQSILYTGEIYYSSNYGVSWSNQHPPSSGASYSSCTMSSDASVMLVGGGLGGTSFIYKSTDYGSTWSSVYTNTSGSAVNGLDIFSNGTTAIASQYSTTFAGDYLVKSTNSGSSWSSITGGSSVRKWKSAVIANQAPVIGYAIVGDSPQYIQQVTSSLSSVSDLTSSTGSTYYYSLSCSDNGNYILAGSVSNLYLSTNGGSSFSAL